MRLPLRQANLFNTPVNQSWSYPDVFGWYKATRT